MHDVSGLSSVSDVEKTPAGRVWHVIDEAEAEEAEATSVLAFAFSPMKCNTKALSNVAGAKLHQTSSMNR
jgi:hypothetical protein